MQPCLISCGILRKEIKKLIESNSLRVEPYFLDASLHTNYSKLGRKLTQAIEECSKDELRGIIVVYGDLCHPKIKEIIGTHKNVFKVDALNCIDCLLGGKLLDIDPNHDYFYLSPGWMPSNLMNTKLGSVLGMKSKEKKKQFNKLKGIILLDSLGNLDEFKDEIEEFSSYTELPILDKREVGTNGLKDIVLKAMKKLKIDG